MSEYFKNEDYFTNNKTEVSKSTVRNNEYESKNQYIKIDDRYYTIRKSERKIIGYVEKQN
jgi:c-di-AMP phosphodiesterase-like protein